MQRRVCDVEGCVREAGVGIQLAVIQTRDAQRLRDEYEGDQDFAGNMDMCDHHMLMTSVRDVYAYVDATHVAQVQRRGLPTGTTLRRVAQDQAQDPQPARGI